jgi:predicted nucleic acid-binding protein
MRVFIADSGPIISFARAGFLDLLRGVLGELWIPGAVYEEIVVKGEEKPGSEEVRQAEWIKRKEIEDKSKLELLALELGQGEKEAIVLAEELKAILIIDDRKARLEAERKGIQTIGSLWVVKEAKDKGLINKAKQAGDKLRDTGLRLKEELYHQFLKEMGEE